MKARFQITAAGPFVSVQDRGRPGYLRFGVTESGPMDRAAFEILRHALGAGIGFSAVEVSMGGISLKCQTGAVTLGVIGGEFDIRLDGTQQSPWSVFSMTEGQILTIRSGASGSWCYLGFAGEIDSPNWLGSQAAHLPSGLCGRALQAGDVLTVKDSGLRRELNGAFPIPDFAHFDGNVRIVFGPQDDHFAGQALGELTGAAYEITQEMDRMGMRLSGPKLPPQDALSIPSEALVRGSVQVPGHGDPLILMADHQTTGGYPKIATIISADLDRVAQLRPRSQLRFLAVSATDAVTMARAHNAGLVAYLERLPEYRGSMVERLYRMNLISGVIGGRSEEPDCI